MTDALLLSCPLSDWRGDPQRCRFCDFLLHGRQQRWCSQECGELAWANHCWSFARPAALKRDRHTCTRCGVKQLRRVGRRFMRTRLDVHHTKELKSRAKRAEIGCHHHLEDLKTLCGGPGSCHHATHYGIEGQLAVAA